MLFVLVVDLWICFIVVLSVMLDKGFFFDEWNISFDVLWFGSVFRSDIILVVRGIWCFFCVFICLFGMI